MKNWTPDPGMHHQDLFGRSVAARLSESAESLPYDISERLRAARVQALSQHKVWQATTNPVLANGGSAALSFGHDEDRLWHRLAALVPLLLLVAGLIAVNVIDDDFRAKELADIDAAILTDDLPPSAYTDAGFAQFLQSHREQAP